ncbi:MAG TPA: T9SS type A sorting domain-containing protein [Saprospiraceae bacterium]|nr:T9SS type A sorting domain-containing protein [Saprospiraceae bacterium]
MKKAGFSVIIILCSIMVNAQVIPTPIITRLEGVGAGENFLELADGEYDKILGNATHGEVTYKPGAAPIRVQIVNPFDVKSGEYIITFVDPIPSDTLSLSTRWILLRGGDTLAIADQPIAQFNEQLIADLGISILIGQSDDAGDRKDPSNGTIGYSLTYSDPGKPQWLTFIGDDFGNVPFTNFIQTELPSYPNYVLDPDHAYSAFAPWVPFVLTDFTQDEPPENPSGWNVTPGWLDPSGGSIQSVAFGGMLQSLNNVDIILTSDTSKWSRCVVVETANNYYTGALLGLPTQGNKKSLQSRSKPSVGKYDADHDGFPDPDGALDVNGNPLTGMGWFPGFAVDVETGDRLNIFFGENSTYSGFVADALGIGTIAHDMIWNPGKQIILPGPGPLTPLETFIGGQQYVYVSRTKYDACAAFRKDLDRAGIIKARALAKVTWCAIPITLDDPTIDLLPLNEGLIPNEVTVKLRVDNPYQLATGNGQYNDNPTYRFKLEGITSLEDIVYRESSFILYPNPSSKTIIIETKIDWIGETIIQVFNTNGELMLGKKFQNQEKMDMDVSVLAAGMYLVEIRNEDGTEIKKMVIQ